MTLKYITEATLTNAASSISITNIPQTYDDLIIYAKAFTGGIINSTFELRFNGSSTNDSCITMTSNGSSVGGGASANELYGICGSPDGGTNYCYSNDRYLIPNYTNNTYKLVLYQSFYNRNSSSQLIALTGSGLWANNSAITSIEFVTNGSNIAAGTSIYLYGQKNS